MNVKYLETILFNSCPHNTTYDMYKEEYDKQEIREWQYAMIQANVVNDRVPIALPHHNHNCDTHGGDNCIPHSLVPQVCEQLYNEGMSVAWRTSTFAFNNGVSFRRFLMSPIIKLTSVPAPQVHQLVSYTENSLLKSSQWLDQGVGKLKFPPAQGTSKLQPCV